jgi:hypothetical protein
MAIVTLSVVAKLVLLVVASGCTLVTVMRAGTVRS